MRYICLVHFDPKVFDTMSPEERREVYRRALDYDDELRARGHYITSQAIQGGDAAVLVRVRKDGVSMTDGPYIETKEQMAGFILIEARDLSEALQLAAGIPLAELGTIEVRPIWEIVDPR